MHCCHLVIKSVIGIQVRLESSDFRLLLKSTILSSQGCVDVANFRTYLHMSLVQCVGTDVVQQIVANIATLTIYPARKIMLEYIQ